MGFVMFTEAAALASSLSMDAFTAGLAYGSNKIKIPFLSVQIINVICGFILGLSLLAGSMLKPYLMPSVTSAICFAALFFSGMVKLLDSITKSFIKKYSDLSKRIQFSVFNFKFILDIYAFPEHGDTDASKVISSKEAASIALALSLDSTAVGFGAALGNINPTAILFFSLFTNAAFIVLGCLTGNRLASKLPFNISWLGGVILIFLAFSKL